MSLENGYSSGVTDEIQPNEEQNLEKKGESEIGEKLATHDLEVIKSMQTDWGPIMAAPETKEHNSYNRIWIRDNALTAIALEAAGERDLAIEMTEGLLLLLELEKDRINSIINEGKPYAVERDVSLIHPVYDAKGKKLDIEWGWHQSDAIGNILQAAGILGLVESHKEIVDLLVKYLEVVEYWGKDRGIWEEMKHVQTNTILSCIAGLEAVSDYTEVPQDLINKGYQEFKKLDGAYSDVREYDMAHLNPIVLGMLTDTFVIQKIEHELLREHGVIRYHGDNYMSGGKGHEAEWVLGLLMLGEAWFVCGNKEEARYYLEKVDSLRTENGDIPEAYVYRDGKYLLGEHTPLAWCHGLALALRRQLENEEKIKNES